MSEPIRTVQVIPEIEEEASGTTYTVTRLCESLIDAGEHVDLAVLRAGSCSARLSIVKEFPWERRLRKLGRSPEMLRWLRDTVKAGNVEIVHSHGLWMMPHVYAGWATRGEKCRLVVSPHGTLSKWALGHSGVAKRLFWLLLQEPAYRHAVCFHAAGESEADDIRRAGLSQPICTIPFGVDLPPAKEKIFGTRRKLLFIGRIHPQKGLENLLYAWHAVSGRHPDWDLHIIGPDDGGFLAKLQAHVRELDIKRVEFTGPLYGEKKWRAYRQAELLVLPSYSENFGMVVAEALISGTPAIATRGAPWEGLERHNAGWWIDIGLEPLIACLDQALSKDRDYLFYCGVRGKEWMIEDYSWSRVGTMMHKTYEWLLGAGELPSCIRFD